MEQHLSLRRFKNKKILTQLFTVLLSFSIILMIVISFLVNYQTTNSILAKNNLIYTNILKISSRTLDTLFFGYHDSLTHITYDTAVINFIVSPKPAESASNYEVLSVLNAYCQENEVIEELYLHVKKTDQILTSTYITTTLEQFQEINLIKHHVANFHSTSLLKSGRTTSIEIYDGNIYLVRDFPLGKEKSLGTLYMKINPVAIYNNTLSDSQTTYSFLLVYDNDWNPLFPNLLDYEKLPDDVLIMLSEHNNDIATTQQIDGYHYFLHTSEQSHINMILSVEDDYFSPSIWDTIKNSIPFLILILVLNILLTACILYLSYVPILNLTKLVSSAEGDDITIDNELNFLMKHFLNISHKREELNQILGSMIPQISKEFYFELLNGTPMELSYIENMLINLESPLKADGIFGVATLTFSEIYDLKRKEETIQHLSQMLNHYSECIFNYIWHRIDENIFVCIIQYNPNTTRYEITNLEIRLEQAIYDFLSDSKQVWLEIGPKCSTIQNISVSYAETLQKITEKKYLPKESSSAVENDNNDSITQDYHYFQIQLKTITDYIMNGNHDLALKKSLQICNSICYEHSADEIMKVYEYYRQALLNTLSAYHIYETVNDEYAFVFEKSPYSSDESISTDIMKEYIEHFCIAATHLLSEKYQKQQHKYLLKAKQYIEKHYINPDLSLNLLAEHCNTSTSYLSRLFKNSFGINFVDYLNKYRIEKAKDLLDTTEETVCNIATATGFNSQQNFIRVFKKHVGLTPGQYRSYK